MFTTGSTPAGDELFYRLEPVALDVLEAGPLLTWRHDCKYVVSPTVLDGLVDLLNREFLVLEIDGRRVFRYRTRYFDSDDLKCYHDHRQGRRRRYKIRTRSYLDSDLHYLEVKLKSLRGTTLKMRRPYRHEGSELSSPEARSFVADAIREAYGSFRDHPLRPRLDVEYARTTLTSRTGNQRVTIDRRISFQVDSGRSCRVPRKCWIIESKGPSGNGTMDAALRRQGHHPVRRCSKYCIGMAVTGQVHQVNRFLPAIKRLGCLSYARPDGVVAAGSP